MNYHELIFNQGFSHIGRQIFELLSFEDLKKSRLVCKLWKEFIDQNPKWNKILLKMAKKKLLLTIHYYNDLDNWTDVSLISKLSYFDAKTLHFSVHQNGGKTKIAK